MISRIMGLHAMHARVDLNPQVSNIIRILAGNEMVDHSDAVGALPVGA